VKKAFISSFLLYIFLCQISFAQKSKQDIIYRLKQHIYILAADSLEGRRTGSEGEQKAARYLLNQYKQL